MWRRKGSRPFLHTSTRQGKLRVRVTPFRALLPRGIIAKMLFSCFPCCFTFLCGSCWDLWLLAFVLSGCTWSYGVSRGGKLLVSIDNESHFGEIQREVQLSRGGRHSFTSGEAYHLQQKCVRRRNGPDTNGNRQTNSPAPLHPRRRKYQDDLDDILRKNRFNGPSSGHQERQAIEELYAPYHLPSLCRPIGEC